MKRFALLSLFVLTPLLALKPSQNQSHPLPSKNKPQAEFLIQRTTPTPTQPPQSDFPRLQVVGNKIVNEEGEVVVLRGMGINDPILLAENRFSDEVPWEEDLFRELRDWGATIVRLPIHPPNFQKDETAALEILDEAIEWAGKNGMYVIIDFHGFGFPPTDFLAELCYTTCAAASKVDTIRFWQTVSERYVGNNTVAFYELFNEPASHPWNGLPEKEEDWASWKDYNELVIDLIREYDFETIILVAGLNFAKDYSYILEAPIERSNVAYVAHHNPTASWDFGEVTERYPVVITELSFTVGVEGGQSFSNELNFKGSQSFRYEATSFAQERDISWVVAAFAPSWGEYSMIENKNYEPTETGLFWKEHLSSYDREMATGDLIHENEDVFSEAVGKWEAIDPGDGSSLSLLISSASENKYIVLYIDEKVPLCGLTNSGVTRWGAEANGRGEAFFTKLDVGPLLLKCDNDNVYVGGLYFDSLVYDSTSDTLTDIKGNIWSRSE